MRTINFSEEDIKQCKLALIKQSLTPLQSAFLMQYITNIEQENKQLQERIEYLERSNNRREDTILEQRQKISDLEDNWNKLKEYINKMHEYFLYTDINEIYEQSIKLDNQFPSLFNLSELNASDRILSSICKKVQELDQGSDD